MFHVLMDDGELIAVLANVSKEQVQDAIVKVDKVFCQLIDEVSNESLPACMCAALGIAPSGLITEWTDVLVALLVDGGATQVDYICHECVPEQSAMEGL